MENLCIFKNYICQTHKCCHFCNNLKCEERCKDNYEECRFKTDEVVKIGKEWNFNLEPTTPTPPKPKGRPSKLPKSLLQYSKKIKSYNKEIVEETTYHTVMLNKGYFTPKGENKITSTLISNIYNELGKAKKQA